MYWLNEPPHWVKDRDVILIHSAPSTDFWRVTALDVIKDTAHFYYEHWIGNFQADVKVSGTFTGSWDQVGLMVRVDEQQWIKCSNEFFEEQQHACVVVTREVSDWSIVLLSPDPEHLYLRITRQGTTVAVYYSLDGEQYRLLRLAYLDPVESVDVGLLCASPEGPGFTARYEGFQVVAEKENDAIM